VRRLPEKATYLTDDIFGIIDDAPFVTIAALVGDLAMSLPTLAGRVDHTLYVHGSQSNAILKAALAAGRVNLTATCYDGIRLARSAFESSIAYRSASVVGTIRVVDDETPEWLIASDAMTDAALAGRSREIRPPRDRERRLTLICAIDVIEGSAKISVGPTDDDDDDAASEVWAGTIPARIVYDEPIARTDGAMSTGRIPLPPSVRALYD
jgi:nitroimidazol reductase NimA-like FMN-containing flavoprotein (pyridoxamine 5'-phosphate oxidase superfamily)